VQMMLTRGSNQVVFSEDGILYLKVPVSKNTDLSIHNYLKDKDRHYFPYHDRPVTERQHNHIFECDKIYADITCAGEKSVFNFKLFKRIFNGDVLVEQLSINSFDREEREITLDGAGVRSYLERQPEEDIRIIFDMWAAVNAGEAISYISSNEFDQTVDRIKLPLDNESILKEYNRKNSPVFIMPELFFADNEKERQKRREKVEKEWEAKAWEKKTIDEVEPFSLTERGFLSTDRQHIITSEDGKIFDNHFEIIFTRENEFLIKERRYSICKDKFKIERGVDHSRYMYTGDPSYIQTLHPPKDVKKMPPKLISTWEELLEVPPTDKYKIASRENNEVWILPLNDEEKLKPGTNCDYVYAYSFSGNEYEASTKLLQRYGFNVEIDNWDKELEEAEETRGAKRLLPSWFKRKRAR